MKNSIYYLITLTFLIYIPFLTKAQSFGYVAIGGGGYVTSVVGCPTEPNLFYAKTDVGGIFRWQEDTKSWKPLFGWVANNQTSYLGAEALAIDPQSPNKIYALVGTDYWDGGKSAILRSEDYGETFKITDVTSLFKAHGNGSDRQKGETLVVDPNKSNILFCGTRYNKGLFKSIDSGVSWQKVTSLNVTDASISFVAFDVSSGTKGTATPNIYVGVHREGENLYVSKDGGISWTAVGGNPQGKPQRCAFSGDGNLYVTYIGTAGGVRKLNLSSGTWTNCTPNLSTNRGFSGIDVDPNNPNRVVTTTYNMWWNEQVWGWADFIFYSEDGGTTWNEKVGKNNATFTNNGIPWLKGAIHWAGCATFNPAKPGWVFVVSGNGVFATENIAATKPLWKFMSKGLEETVMLDLISIPGGPLISSVGDQGGFVHTDVTKAPLAQISQSSGFAFAGQKPATIARVATDLYLSENNGTSWTKLPPTPDAMTKGKVAVSADGKTILWKSTVNSLEKCWVTTTKGASWTASSGINFSCSPAADPVVSSRFYAYNRTEGYLYVSEDGGLSFQKAGLAGINGNARIATWHGKEGHIWIAMGSSGIKYSSDSGKSFQTVSVYSAEVVAVGKEMPGTDIPTIFIYGRSKSSDVIGIYRSTDWGKTWVRADDNQHQFGHLANAGMIEADRTIYGRVYRSTAGMGIPYMDAQIPTAVQTAIKSDEAVLFPNPFTSSITLQAGKSKIELVQVYNLNGSLLKTIIPNQQTIRFGHDLETGMYLVKVSGEKSMMTFKIIKK
ncbi:MAG: T9SS type A sorting domain-containing protein [Prolixibacteraceae bacterium]|nr:T9SS type A sorting domain-containing protein [Prolixibacteraceae bacterium]